MDHEETPKRLDVVLIGGLGQIGQNQHIPVILKHRDKMTLTAIVDTDDSYPENKLPSSVHLYESLGDANEKHPSIDAAIIACPPQFSQDYAKEALKLDLHVFMEKPPGLHRKGLESLVDMAQDRNLTLFTGYHSAFCPCIQDAKRWVKENKVVAVDIEWKESAAKWHPGQTWITEKTGLGVFDCVFNPFSILDEIGILMTDNDDNSSTLELKESKLYVPANWKSPIAGISTFTVHTGDGGDCNQCRIVADYAWNYEGSDDIWNISFTSNDGNVLELRDGGAELYINGAMHGDEVKDRANYDKLRPEYEAMYNQFIELISVRQSYARMMPLHIINEILEKSEMHAIENYTI